MRVDGVFRGGNGPETFLARDRVKAVEPCLSPADEEGSDAGGDVENHLSLGTGCMAEVPGSFARSEAVAAC